METYPGTSCNPSELIITYLIQTRIINVTETIIMSTRYELEMQFGCKTAVKMNKNLLIWLNHRQSSM